MLTTPNVIRVLEAAGDRDRRFRGERARQVRRLASIQRDTAAEIQAQLDLALRRIAADLAQGGSSFKTWHLTNLERAVREAIRDAGAASARAVAGAADRAWSAGADLVDAPLDAGGIRVAGVLPSIDVGQLDAMKNFMTARMRDVPLAIVDRINAELAQVVIGTSNVGDAIAAIEGLVEGGRSRALTIVRTEIGRAYSVAAQERMAQAGEVVLGLKKQWRRSGKVYSRVGHDLVDGQIRDVDEPFLVDGVALMFPRDPMGPPAQTVNCGCVALPILDEWS